jgi:lipopolysaccharide transport system permease protein
MDMHFAVRAAWRYRGFIAASVRREFVSKYLNTQLGFFWAIAQPLTLIIIYTLVFANLMRPGLPGHDSRFAYSIYLTAGVILWIMFGELLGRAVGIFVQNAQVLKKVSVPKITLPAIASATALVNFAIALGIFLVFLAIYGYWPGWPVLGIVPVVLVLLLFAVSLGLLLATINVFYRDVEQSVSIALQFWFWLTPIVYTEATLPEGVRKALSWNPMWALVRAMQDIFLDRRWPDWPSLAWPAALAVVFLFLAYRVFVKLQDEIVDEL